MGGLPVLKAAGLQTAHNPFSATVDGGLQIAKNCVIYANHVLEPRRGHRNYTYTLLESASGTFFGDSLVAQHGEASMSYDTGSAFTAYSGTFTPVDDSLLRMKFAEAQQQVFFNTKEGVKTISTLTGTPRAAGVRKPSVRWGDGVSTGCRISSGTGAGEWIAADCQVAFRFVYGFYADGGRPVLGPPSERVVLINTHATDGRTCTLLTSDLVSALPSDTFVRVYRTDFSGSKTTDPGDTMYLHYEQNLTLFGATPSFTFEGDYYPLSTTPLYTNANVEGGLQANFEPPVAKDIMAADGRLWFANTRARQRFSLELLGVGAPDGIQTGDTFTLGGETYVADTTFAVYTAGTPAEDLEFTTKAIVDAINVNSTAYRAYWISGVNDAPGKMLIESADFDDAEFKVYASRGESWNPVLEVSSILADESSDDTLPHGLFYSKPDQPESVPLTNYLLIGSKNKAILRTLPLREKRYVFKEDGIFTVTGQEPFTVDQLDGTTRLVSPDSAVVLNNQIICLTNQGVVAVSDAGVQLLSRPIEDEIGPYLNENMRELIARHSFGVAHETDRSYELWVAGAHSDSTACEKAYVWNTITQSWTTWEVATARKWGCVSPTDVRYYGGIDSKVFYERRDFASTDYADEATVLPAYVDFEMDADGNCTSVQLDGDIEIGDAVEFTAPSGASHAVIVATFDSSNGETTFNESVLAVAFDDGAATATLHKAFESDVQWRAISFDRPGSLKRFQYGSMHFGKPTAFNSALATYETETSGFVTTEALSTVTYGFGTNEWGVAPYGDSTKNITLRHTIPAEKQRGAMMYPGFRIKEAYAAWKLHGLTLDTEETSERTGR